MKTLIALVTLFAASISSISLSNNETLTIALFALSFVAVIAIFAFEKWGKQIKAHVIECVNHKIDWGFVSAVAFVIVLFIASVTKVIITSPAFNL